MSGLKMVGKVSEKLERRIRNPLLVGTPCGINGSSEQTDLTFPVVLYAPDGVYSQTQARILMPARGEGGIAVLDIKAGFNLDQWEIGEQIGGVTKIECENPTDLTSKTNRQKREIYHNLSPTTVVLNTDLDVQEGLAKVVLRGRKGFLDTETRENLTPVNRLDYVVERTYDVMRQIADEIAVKRQNMGMAADLILGRVGEEELTQFGVSAGDISSSMQNYKSHGLFVLVGNGELGECSTHGIGENIFDPKTYPENAERYVYGDYAKQLLGRLIEEEGAVIIDKTGKFRENGARIRLPDKLVELYRRKYKIDIHDGEAIRNFMYYNEDGRVRPSCAEGIEEREVGTKHITAAEITLIDPYTVALALSGEENILSLIRGGRVEREYRPKKATATSASYDAAYPQAASS